MLSDINCELLLAEFSFERDARRPPDNRRKGRFRAGWEDAVLRGRSYDSRILKRLTWHNLGYRLGKMLGEKSVDEIYEIYERFSQHYNTLASNGTERNIFPEEVDEDSSFLEGPIRRITVNAYERNPQARSKCIARYGTHCFICGFDLNENMAMLEGALSTFIIFGSFPKLENGIKLIRLPICVRFAPIAMQ